MKSGFLLDAHETPNGIGLWLALDDGSRPRLERAFSPGFALQNEGMKTRRAVAILQERFGRDIRVVEGKGNDLLKGEVPLFEIKAKDPCTFERLKAQALRSDLFEGLCVYGVDTPAVSQFFLKTGMFPFCRFAFKDGEPRVCDEPLALDYPFPSLRVLEVSLEPEGLDPMHARRAFALCLRPLGEEEGLVLEACDKEGIEGSLKRFDPDVILAPFGDGYTLKRLLAMGVRTLSREGFHARLGEDQTIASYGKVYARKGPVLLSGRLHIDPRNSFFYPEVGLAGLIELSRVCAIPLQELARTTPGRAITRLEARLAGQRGFLVPFQKGVPEGFKTLETFLRLDKGGLSFRPLVGFFENVAEYDFASMYPSIIVNFNLSYETLNCGHPSCQTRLPVSGYGVCSKRTGIVPFTLKRLIERRETLKARAALESDSRQRQALEQRQKALKWLLVVSFGYLGYRNAKFGRIEAHEATTAIGRELLLFAKEIAEARGFKLLHALTDALWVQKEGAQERAYVELEHEIIRRVNAAFKPVLPDGVPWKVRLEGVYAWVRFLASKAYGVGVGNRYVGVFQDRTIKARGILLRRSDTPPLIREFQEQALQLLAGVSSIEGLRRQYPTLQGLTKAYEARLEEGKVRPEALAVRLRLARNPLDYQKRSFLAEAAQSLLAEGLGVSLGETVRFVRVQDKALRANPLWLYHDNPKPIDTAYYAGLLQEALEELLPQSLLKEKALP